MNKDEILEKSGEENKNQGDYEKDVTIKAANIGAISAAVLCLVLYGIQLFTGNGADYGICAILFMLQAADHTVMAVKLKRKKNIIFAVFYIVITAAASVAHVLNVLG